MRLGMNIAAMAAAIAVSAPSAHACFLAEDGRFALRAAPPEQVLPGEVVLEIDRKSIVGGVQGQYTRFDVKRVVSGEYKDSAVLVSFLGTTCDYLAFGDKDSYVIGKISAQPGKPTILIAHMWPVEQQIAPAKARN